MDYMVFQTHIAAIREVAKMRGWHKPRAVLLYLPEHEWANPKGNVWIIEVGLRDAEKYLRSDGFVR